VTTLTTTISIYKKLIYWTIGAIVVSIIILILFRLGGVIKNQLIPTPPSPATIAFRVLPKLDFSEGYEPLVGTRFLIETISGDLPSFGEKAKVFEIKNPISKFGDLEKVINNAKRAGFSNPPIKITNEIAIFEDPKDNSRILTVGTISGSIALKSSYLTNPVIITPNSQSQRKAQEKVSGFFGQLKVPLQFFPEESITFEEYKIENGILEKSVSQSTTNLVKVIFNNLDLDEIPIINPDGENPLVWGLANDSIVVSAQFVSNDIQRHRFSTYPLRGVDLALEDLRRGNGALNKKPNSNTFPIRKVQLAYLETKGEQEYLQPVYVFESDNGLIAYTSAVKDTFISKD